ncbi:hypothetical protein Hanom_Chr02g00147241 [Helianthus anomalus]
MKTGDAVLRVGVARKKERTEAATHNSCVCFCSLQNQVRVRKGATRKKKEEKRPTSFSKKERPLKKETSAVRKKEKHRLERKGGSRSAK